MKSVPKSNLSKISHENIIFGQRGLRGAGWGLGGGGGGREGGRVVSTEPPTPSESASVFIFLPSCVHYKDFV